MDEQFTDNVWMGLAIREAQQAYEIGEVPVGAVIILDNQIIGKGHNQAEKLKDPTAHAEMLAISAGCESIGDWRLENAIMYSTLEPCSMCAGAAVLARIKKIVFGASDPKFGACGSIFNIPVDPRLNHRIELQGGIMAPEIAAMMRDFFREIRQSKEGLN